VVAQVDVIAAYHTPAVRAAMNATKTIPIVMARPVRRPRNKRGTTSQAAFRVK
jgi:hypothetical protein